MVWFLLWCSEPVVRSAHSLPLMLQCSSSRAVHQLSRQTAEEPVTQESLKELRSQLEEQLYEAQELQKRLNAQLDSLNKRVSKVEKKTDQPAVDIHGYGRFRWDKQHFEDFKGIDMKSVWMNLFVNHRINDKWSLHSEHAVRDNAYISGQFLWTGIE